MGQSTRNFFPRRVWPLRPRAGAVSDAPMPRSVFGQRRWTMDPADRLRPSEKVGGPVEGGGEVFPRRVPDRTGQSVSITLAQTPPSRPNA